MKPKIELRSLKPQDYDEVIRVWIVAGLPYKLQGRDSLAHLTSEILRTPELYLGAFADDKLIGTVIGTYDGRRGCINRLAVVPQYRHSGVAMQLISLCEERLRKYGSTIIYCLINDENVASQSVFKKAGYTHHEHIYYFSKRDSDNC